ncbi:hypothetical protein L211DRAFT_898403 [Terfezia boudieri ATCC MYA-4762]|uniref:Uncharacterized protein n=1 Tax=Terfezia boudieri ATCC MYA-4762 TaxID=1051890 RepID=A0A3N4LUP3_9PEZI|nr:hypothetical protein L211DRAFT_898403 [Terfezia boudieri ATCC MYA-4762]
MTPYSGNETPNQALLHLPDSSKGKFWPTPEYEVIIASNEGRRPKPIDKARKARHRAAIAMLEEIEGILNELGEIHTFLLNQACPDVTSILQIYKYHLKLSNFLQDGADNFLVYEMTNTGPVAVDADIKGLAEECELAKKMLQAIYYANYDAQRVRGFKNIFAE